MGPPLFLSLTDLFSFLFEVLAETTPISGALPHNVLQLTPLYNIWRRQRGFMCFCKRLYFIDFSFQLFIFLDFLCHTPACLGYAGFSDAEMVANIF
jgi:hypothetical protein